MHITLEDFKKVEINVGKILSAEKVPETEKLLKLSVDFGVKRNPSAQDAPLPLGKGESNTTTPAFGHPSSTEEGKDTPVRDVRQIISGIAMYFPAPQALVGKKCMFVTNIPVRTIKGLESNGMILAASTDDGRFSLLEPSAEIPEGTHAR